MSEIRFFRLLFYPFPSRSFARLAARCFIVALVCTSIAGLGWHRYRTFKRHSVPAPTGETVSLPPCHQLIRKWTHDELSGVLELITPDGVILSAPGSPRFRVDFDEMNASDRRFLDSLGIDYTDVRIIVAKNHLGLGGWFSADGSRVAQHFYAFDESDTDAVYLFDNFSNPTRFAISSLSTRDRNLLAHIRNPPAPGQPPDSWKLPPFERVVLDPKDCVVRDWHEDVHRVFRGKLAGTVQGYCLLHLLNGQKAKVSFSLLSIDDLAYAAKLGVGHHLETAVVPLPYRPWNIESGPTITARFFAFDDKDPGIAYLETSASQIKAYQASSLSIDDRNYLAAIKEPPPPAVWTESTLASKSTDIDLPVLRIVKPTNGVLKIEPKYLVVRVWTNFGCRGRLLGVDSSGLHLERENQKIPQPLLVHELSEADEVFLEQIGIDWVRSSFTLEQM
jgi:hypothetical protein